MIVIKIAENDSGWWDNFVKNAAQSFDFNKTMATDSLRQLWKQHINEQAMKENFEFRSDDNHHDYCMFPDKKTYVMTKLKWA
jgi:hypothetical protein